jgi:peptide/nickel transport system permease protein
MSVAYVAGRLGQLILVLLGISLVAFILLRLKGDPAALMLPAEAGEEQLEAFRQAMGFDRPLPEQFGKFLLRAAAGDFGRSLRYNQPALELVVERFPATVSLALAALTVSVLVAVPAGILSAVYRYSLFDQAAMSLALLGQSMPVFWLGLLMILVFAVHLRLLPSSGGGGPEHLVLPALTLGLYSAGRIARLVRSSMLEALGQDYIRTARAKGLPELPVICVHGLRNALLPVVTLVGLELGSALGGAVITETVFAWPGVGRLVVGAIFTRDYPVVQAGVCLIAASFALVNLAVDLLYTVLDPRIRHG